MTHRDDLWSELTGDDWDESEDGDAGEVIGDGEHGMRVFP